MMPILLEGMREVVGSPAADTFTTPAFQITYGLDGNDMLSAASGSYSNVLVGGPGDDTYATAWNSTIFVIDSGGYDRIFATGMDVFSPYTYAMTLEGRHFAAADLRSLEAVIIVDAFSPATAIEEVHLASGVYSFDFIRAILPYSANYIGNVSIQTAAENGLFPPGTTSRDTNEALQWIRVRESELLTASAGAEEVVQPHEPVQPDAPAFPVETAVHAGVNADFYYAMYPDVAAAGLDAGHHYSLYGWREGRDPNSLFDTSWYLERNPDVAAAGINPLDHYMNFGWKEGRDPSPDFSTVAYLERNPDVAVVGMNPLEHYLVWGMLEGREIG